MQTPRPNHRLAPGAEPAPSPLTTLCIHELELDESVIAGQRAALGQHSTRVRDLHRVEPKRLGIDINSNRAGAMSQDRPG